MTTRERGPGRTSVPAVEIEGLTVRYGDLVAVDDVSFTARHGEVTAVLGPNGAGKTTTIEVCEGYRTATTGTVRVLGLDPARQQQRLAERMGVMLQEGGISPGARARDAVRQYCALYGRGVDPDELVRRVGLAERSTATWRRMSGGERQRLSLALALAARPDVAFLDEPTSGVDVHGRDTIREVVRELAGGGCAVVLATHELDEAERLADRVVIFDRGEVVADGTLDELRRGHDEIRFRTVAGLDLAALATATGLEAAPIGDPASGEYRIETASDARTVALLTSWLGEQGHGLVDLRAGAQRLEDVFRRLTSGAGAEAGAVGGSGDPGGQGERRARGGRAGRRSGRGS